MRLSKVKLLVLLLGLSMTVDAQIDSTDTDVVIFNKVEVEAYYPGGESAWREYLQKNLNAATPINNSAPTGQYQVWVQFIVSRDGSLSDIKALTKLGYGMETEVMRIIRKSGKWEPAQQGGRFVKAYRLQPVTFMVQDESFDISTQTPYVLFTGTDNAVSIDVPKVKEDDLIYTISQGTLTRLGSGRILVRVNKPGRVVLEIHNTKKNKKIGAASFEVRAPGDAPYKPVAIGSN